MLDSTPSSALINGTTVYSPSRSLLKNALDTRLLNQSAYFYFDLRQLSTGTLTQTFQPSSFWWLPLGSQLSALAQLWEAGLIKKFAIAPSFYWRIEPNEARDKAELKELYQSDILTLKEYIREALSFDYPEATNFTAFNFDKFSSDWGISLKDIFFWLRDMEKREYIAFTIPTNTASVTWHSTPVKGLNLAELKELRRLKHLNEKGYTLIAVKAVRPTNGTINTDLLETLWQIDPTKVFEALAEYQARSIASLYLENIIIEWVEMPPYFSREKLSDRKGMYRQHGFLYHALRVDNPTGTLTQAIKLSHIEADWKLKPQDSIRYIKRLTQLGLIKADLSQLNITWYW